MLPLAPKIISLYLIMVSLAPKIISLYLTMLSLIASSVDIKFPLGIFISFLSCNHFDNFFCSVICCKLDLGYKSLFTSLSTAKSIHHHHHSKCYIADFLHHSIYTLHHIPGDGRFYFVCKQSQSLVLFLH